VVGFCVWGGGKKNKQGNVCVYTYIHTYIYIYKKKPLRHIHVTMAAMEKKYVLNIMNVSIHASLMLRIILPSVACLAVIFFHINSQTA
jgi:hypothetical protein